MLCRQDVSDKAGMGCDSMSFEGLNYRSMCFIMNCIYPESCDPSRACNRFDASTPNACELLSHFCLLYSADCFEYFNALYNLAELNLTASADAKRGIKVVDQFVRDARKATAKQKATLLLIKAYLLARVGKDREAITVVKTILNQNETEVVFRYAAVSFVGGESNIPVKERLALVVSQERELGQGQYSSRFNTVIKKLRGEQRDERAGL
jgi:hypothetical protein